MDFAFYNEIGGGSVGGAVLSPVRRAIRRVMRPTFFRLRDLLQFLFDKQQEERAVIVALRDELVHVKLMHADLEARFAALLAEHQKLAADHASLNSGHTSFVVEHAVLATDLATVRAERQEDWDAIQAEVRPILVEAAAIGRRLAVLEDALLRSQTDRAAA